MIYRSVCKITEIPFSFCTNQKCVAQQTHFYFAPLAINQSKVRCWVNLESCYFERNTNPAACQGDEIKYFSKYCKLTFHRTKAYI